MSIEQTPNENRTIFEQTSNKCRTKRFALRGREILSRRLRDGVFVVRLLFTLKLYSTFRIETPVICVPPS